MPGVDKSVDRGLSVIDISAAALFGSEAHPAGPGSSVVRPLRSVPPLPVLIRPAVPRPLVQALARCADEQFSGMVRVTGDPGGALHLVKGQIVAVRTPGAPDVEALLLRSGRVGEEDWAAAFHAGAAEGRIGAELVARHLVGAAELQVLCMMAVLDGAFALAAGRVDGCTPDRRRSDPPLPAPHGVEPERVLQETERRLRALASFRTPVSPDRDRVVPTRHAAGGAAGPRADERREILLRANGRRSSRDLAYLLGRGVYAITVETARMLDEGLVEISSRRVDPETAGPAPAAAPAGPDGRLPRRRPGASGINDVLPARPAGAGRLRPRTLQTEGPGAGRTP